MIRAYSWTCDGPDVNQKWITEEAENPLPFEEDEAY